MTACAPAWREPLCDRTSPAAAAARRASSRLPRLLDEAARAFAQRGFAAASVREIVEPVGMLPGSLYCHFATKEALLAAVYKEGVERIGAAVDAAIAPLDEPVAAARGGCVAHLASLLDQTDYSQVVIRVRPSDAPAAEAELVALRDSYEKRFAPPGRGAAAGAPDRPHDAAPDAGRRAQLEPDLVSRRRRRDAREDRAPLRRPAEGEPRRSAKETA